VQNEESDVEINALRFIRAIGQGVYRLIVTHSLIGFHTHNRDSNSFTRVLRTVFCAGPGQQLSLGIQHDACRSGSDTSILRRRFRGRQCRSLHGTHFGNGCLRTSRNGRDIDRHFTSDGISLAIRATLIRVRSSTSQTASGCLVSTLMRPDFLIPLRQNLNLGQFLRAQGFNTG
jgi:hypothetical protein